MTNTNTIIREQYRLGEGLYWAEEDGLYMQSPFTEGL